MHEIQILPCWFAQKAIGAGGRAVVDPCWEFGFAGVVGWFGGVDGFDGLDGFDGVVIFCCWLGAVPASVLIVGASVFTVVNPISVLIWTIVASMVVDPFKIPWMWTGNKQ